MNQADHLMGCYWVEDRTESTRSVEEGKGTLRIHNPVGIAPGYQFKYLGILAEVDAGSCRIIYVSVDGTQQEGTFVVRKKGVSQDMITKSAGWLNGYLFKQY